MSLASALQGIADQLPPFRPGSVWLAGAGPGDPGLLTLQAVAALQAADAIVHDALVGQEVLSLAPAEAVLVYAGKRGGHPSPAQPDISARLIDLARQGLRVLRLKGGDPYVFGRGHEEALALAAAGIPFRVIPGLTAGLAGLAAAGIPATARGVNQAVILATAQVAEREHALDWAAMARLGQPIVLYMALHVVAEVTAAMLRAGIDPDLPAAAVAGATTPDERVLVTTLAELARAVVALDPRTPTTIVIGRIVSERARLRRIAAAPALAAAWP